MNESDFENSMKKRWVVILVDPDFDGESTWSVVAETKDEAIRAALTEYDLWAENETPTPFSNSLVSRVYANSWIGKLV